MSVTTDDFQTRSDDIAAASRAQFAQTANLTQGQLG